MTTITYTTWTLAYRKPRANRFQRVTNWEGTWAQARELAQTFAAAHADLQVYYIPSAASDAAGWSAPEDRGNILVDSGRRVRMTETGRLSDEILAQVPDADEAQARWRDGAY